MMLDEFIDTLQEHREQYGNIPVKSVVENVNGYMEADAEAVIDEDGYIFIHGA